MIRITSYRFLVLLRAFCQPSGSSYIATRSRRTAAILLALLSSVITVALGAGLLTDDQARVKRPVIHVHSCEDFEVSGNGASTQWRRAEWVQMNKRPEGKLDYQTRFKMLYSKTGVYVLFDATDDTLTATMTEDFSDLWNEDVFECFFWTDERHPVYFEYEISPLGYELPILIPNLGGKFLGWRPWHYEGERKTRKAVVAQSY